MRTIEQVACEPEPGDEATLVGGQVVYRVREVTIAPNPATGGRTTTIRAEREETFRSEPYTRSQEVLCLLPVWTDLVLRAAATVGPA